MRRQRSCRQPGRERKAAEAAFLTESHSRDDRVPLLGREVLDVGHVLDAGVVDEHVDAAELFFRKGHHGLDLGRLAHVRLRKQLEPLDAIRTLRNVGYVFAGVRQ